MHRLSGELLHRLLLGFDSCNVMLWSLESDKELWRSRGIWDSVAVDWTRGIV